MVQSVALVPRRNSSIHLYVAKLRCRHVAESRTALAAALTGFSVCRLLNLASVIRSPFLLQSYSHYSLSFRAWAQFGGGHGGRVPPLF